MTGSIGSEALLGQGVKRGSQGAAEPSESNSNMGSVSAAQSVSEQDDVVALMHKFKALRREN